MSKRLTSALGLALLCALVLVAGVAVADVIRAEAEDMAENSDALSAVTDGSVKAMRFKVAAADATTTVNIPNDTAGVVLRARSTVASSKWPAYRLDADGVKISKQLVNSTTYSLKRDPVSLPEGSHTLKLRCATADATLNSGSCTSSRQLFVDYIEFSYSPPDADGDADGDGWRMLRITALASPTLLRLIPMGMALATPVTQRNTDPAPTRMTMTTAG